MVRAVTLGIKMAQKPYVAWSLGPKALIYESLDPMVQEFNLSYDNGDL